MATTQSILVRYVPQRWLAQRLAIVLWIGASSLPFLLSHGYRSALFQNNMFGQVLEVTLLLAALPIVFLLELMLFSAVLGFFKSQWITRKRIVSLFALGVCAVIVACYLVLIAFSWKIFEAAEAFPSGRDLLLLLGTLDPSNILRVSSTKDLLLGSALLSMAMLLAGVLLLLSPPISRATTVAKRIGPPLGCMLLLAIGLRLYFGTAALSNAHSVLQGTIAPQYALLWGTLLYGQGEELQTPDSFSLEPAVPLSEYATNVKSEPKTNVVIIVIEALRNDVLNQSVSGISVTPTMNKLAEKGVVIPHAYAQSSETSYSQSTILTALYPLKYPRRDTNRQLDYQYVTGFDLFKALGYQTSYFTAEWDISRRLSAKAAIDLYVESQSSLQPEVRTVLPEKYRMASTPNQIPTAVLDAAHIDVFGEWLRQRQEPKPFFSVFYLYSTHFPYDAADWVDGGLFQPRELTESPSFFQYPESQAATLKNRYLASARYTDQLVQRLLDQLRSLNLHTNTMLVITGDHGELFHEHGKVTHGHSLYEEVIRVPLIFSVPGRKVPRAASVGGHVDILPSILDLLALPPHPAFQGVSLFGNSDRQYLYSSVQSLTYEDAVIHWPWKLVKNYRGRGTTLEYLGTGDTPVLDTTAMRTALDAALDEFRKRQFYYFASEQRFTHYPPQH